MLLTIGECISMAFIIWLGILACLLITKGVLDEMHEIENERKRRK